ncbi:MAG: hypothetical protein H6709_04195 [Kofleriaceae bacterium]|nr:hypothetical protein [Myxococcales bacterium]MCB9560166.1 hypothetical protein [Kofleriaceae bacterium]MCB9571272.1 hypothetical protein [Kofleriaceae bacterium]
MLADWSRLLRLCLVLTTVTAATTYKVIPAYADDDDDEDDADDSDDEDDDAEDDEDQPPVTAGGLYTKKTYPISEIERPLTITRKMSEFRAGIDVDVSDQKAFEKWGLGFDYRYGLEDNVELQGDLRTDLNDFTDFVFKAAIEASISYDLVDFRLGIAIPYTKDPITSDGTTRFGFELGFPFRYAPKPQVAVVALDTFMTIDTDSKPDLTPSIGIIAQPVEQLAVKLNATLNIVDFDTSADNFRIPVSINIQFTPKRAIDIGGEFTFPNLKPETGNFYDSRKLLLYGQFRF